MSTSTTPTTVVRLTGGGKLCGSTVAVITHDREIAERMGRRIRVQDGRVTEDRM